MSEGIWKEAAVDWFKLLSRNWSTGFQESYETYALTSSLPWPENWTGHFKNMSLALLLGHFMQTKGNNYIDR
jgi:hypothetical protein